jgi:hypothetical protein
MRFREEIWRSTVAVVGIPGLVGQLNRGLVSQL